MVLCGAVVVGVALIVLSQHTINVYIGWNWRGKHVSGEMKWHLLTNNSAICVMQRDKETGIRNESIIDSEGILTITLWIFNEIK